MGQVTADISISLDGFVAGPDASMQDPLGRGGEQLHEWVLALAGWRRRHGYEGGETGIDDDVLEEANRNTRAVVMGRRMFSGGAGPWDDDPNATGWWGEEPPFHVPVFVVTHHHREPLVMQGGTTFTFVPEGVGRAVELAREAAGDGDVLVSGGGSVIEQALRAGLLDAFQLHVVPVLLGGGVRLFDGRGDAVVRLETDRAIGSTGVTHLRYRVTR
jgi:dihydrofolate reductase